MTSNNLITHDIDGAVICQRATDGYLNATAMCTAVGKLWADYNRLKVTGEYLAELEADMGIPISELVQSIKGGTPELQGTWVHPYVAVHLAQWLSPRFAVQVSKWVYDFTADLRRAAGELNRRVDEWFAQGRTPEWVRERLDGMFTRKELTDFWRSDGLLGRSHFGILTRLLQMRSVGLGPKELKELKGLKKHHSLRDNCTELELLLIRLGERSTIEIARAHEARGYGQQKNAALEGGQVAENARLQLEKLIGEPIASPKNFLPKPPAALPPAESSDQP